MNARTAPFLVLVVMAVTGCNPRSGLARSTQAHQIPSQASSSLVMTRKPTKSPIESPGEEIQNTRVVVPSRIEKGGTLEGKAPFGSRIEAFGQQTHVGPEGNFQLAAPSLPGTYFIKVYRPKRKTPFVLRIEVTL